MMNGSTAVPITSAGSPMSSEPRWQEADRVRDLDHAVAASRFNGQHRPERGDDHGRPDQHEHERGESPPTTFREPPVGKEKASRANRAKVNDTVHQ